MCVFCDVINLARACHNYYKSEFNLFSWRMFISQHYRITHPWNAINTADPALYIELNLTSPIGYDVWRVARNLSLAAIHDGVESGEGAKYSVFSL